MQKKELSDIVSQYRAEKKLSLAQFSERVGYTRSFIAKIERKETGVSLKTIKALATGMNMDVNELINLLEGNNEAEDDQFLIKKLHNNKELRILVRKFIVLTDEQIELVSKYIETL